MTAAAPHQQGLHARAGVRTHFLMRSTLLHSQQFRMFSTDNDKTIDITQASEEAEPIIT